jgi:hypothetical protein
LRDNIDKTRIKKTTETVIDFSKVVDLEINEEKIKYTLFSRRQNASQNHDVKITNRSFEKVE